MCGNRPRRPFPVGAREARLCVRSPRSPSFVGLLLSALPAQAGPIREAAAKRTTAAITTAAVAVSAEQPQSPAAAVGRWPARGAVSALIAGGLLLVRQKCDGIRLGNRCVGSVTWLGGSTMTGVAVMTGGVLLATMFADVPANNAVTLTVAPDRVSVGKTFGF